MKAFEKPGEKPQREKLKQRGDERRMNEAVRQGLPQRPMQKVRGNEAKAQNERHRIAGHEVLAHPVRKKCAQIDEDELPGDSAKCGKGKRTGSEFRHRKVQGIRLCVRVSWSRLSERFNSTS